MSGIKYDRESRIRIIGDFAWCIESMKEEQILVETPKYEAKFERNLDPHKSTKHNIRLIKHNRSIIKSKILSLTRK